MAASWLTYSTSNAHVSAEGPDYFRDVYPYVLPPLVKFEREPVALDPAPAIWVSRIWFAVESSSLSTAAIPPCAQALAASRSSCFVINATFWVSASLNASDMPAKPLPIISTS